MKNPLGCVWGGRVGLRSTCNGRRRVFADGGGGCLSSADGFHCCPGCATRSGLPSGVRLLLLARGHGGVFSSEDDGGLDERESRDSLRRTKGNIAGVKCGG